MKISFGGATPPKKRQDAGDHIVINWSNIERGSVAQYEACIEANDPDCSRYSHYDTPYDCMSIMHYRLICLKDRLVV